MQYKIISIRDRHEYSGHAIDWFSSKWGIDRKEYEMSFADCISKNESLPQWYLALDKDDEIIGGCGLIQNDFVDRVDLLPYICALFVEEKARGHALGAKLLENARIEGGKLCFDRLYLCTDHTAYYEKYGWNYIATGNHPWGSTSRIYEAPTIKEHKLEKMTDFFCARVDGYDEHMLNDVEGCKPGYIKMAELVPGDTKTMLDLGCGTGLELDQIWGRLPDISVVGIDLTQAMLDKLQQKHSDKDIRLICGSYFDVDFGENVFDTAISFQTMHHFTHEEKIKLYQKIYKALKPDGVYIECDYMVTEQSAEDELYAENARIRRNMNIPEGEFYHYDTPCTIDNQIAILKKSGFLSSDMVWRMGNTTIITAKKKIYTI